MPAAGTMQSYIQNIFTSSYGDKKPKFFFWYAPGTTKADKKLIFKIDFFILTYACLNFFIKWLDQANLSNAYVSGMKEDLNMMGTQFNTMNTCFQVGSIVGSLISNLFIIRISPRYWLPGCELAWGLITIFTYKVHSSGQVRVAYCSSHFLHPVSQLRLLFPSAVLLELGNSFRCSEAGRLT